MLGAVLEVDMSKKCTPLWRKAHLEVKMRKAPHVRSTFVEVEILKKCTPLWRKAHLEVKLLSKWQQKIMFGPDLDVQPHPTKSQ